MNDILDGSVLPTLRQQFGEGPFLFQHDNAPVHKARSIQKYCFRSVWKNLTGLHRALTSTPSNTFGMTWYTDCEPGLIAQHQCRPHECSWLNGSKSRSNAPISSRKPSQKSRGCYSSEGGPNSILMPMILEWYFRRAGVHILLILYLAR